jgi:DNA-binding MarR family transcriptional regulator
VSEKPLADPLALENQVCFALSLASRSVIAAYKPVLEPLNLTHPQYLVMLTLWEHEPLSIKALSALLHLDPGTLSPLVKRIESLGYVVRRRNAADERALDVSLTDAGVALRTQAEAVPGQVVERLGMPLAELEGIRDSITALLDHLR